MQNFLSLSKMEQRDLLFQFGKILISSIQGDVTTTLYSLRDFFVKVTKDVEGLDKIEAFSNLDNLKLNDTSH